MSMKSKAVGVGSPESVPIAIHGAIVAPPGASGRKPGLWCSFQPAFSVCLCSACCFGTCETCWLRVLSSSRDENHGLKLMLILEVFSEALSGRR